MFYEDLVSEPLPTLVNLYTKLELPVDYKSIRAAIDYIKKPIPDVVIKNHQGGLFSEGNLTLVLGLVGLIEK